MKQKSKTNITNKNKHHQNTIKHNANNLAYNINNIKYNINYIKYNIYIYIYIVLDLHMTPSGVMLHECELVAENLARKEK